MKRLDISWRAQVGLVGACYGAVLAFAAVVVTGRYLLERRSPNDFNGGMAAAGDWMLELFLCGLLLIPTFLLAFISRRREQTYTTLSKFLFGFSLLAPVSLGLVLIPAIGQKDTILGSLCSLRLFGAPMVIVGLIGCRVLARFRLAKRLLSWAVAIESATIVMMVAGLFY